MPERKRIWILMSVVLVLLALDANAHTIDYDVDLKVSAWQLFRQYLGLGYNHILPLGYDHVLFIMCVFFLSKDIKKVVIQASAFTLSHTITLGLGLYGFIKPPATIIEPLIALSIVVLALENIFSDRVRSWRIVMVFLFGLVHGMGFASDLIAKLEKLQLSRKDFISPLLGFSLGVELGQLTIIVFLYLAVSRPFAKRPWYRKKIVIPVSIVIASIALLLTLQRIFFPGLIP